MQMMRKTLATIAALGVVMGGALAVPAAAQDMTMPAPGPEVTGSSVDFDSATLDAFIMAFVEVNRVGQEYGAQFEAAETAEAQQQVMQDANSEMLVAIEGVEGIEVDEYNQIMTVAQADPELAERINQRLQDIAAMPTE
jgi:hypothetical protein